MANNQNVGRSPLARLRARAAAAAAAGTVSYSQGKRTFRPTIRTAAAANDNKLPPSILVYRALALGAIAALLAAAFID